MNLAEDVDLEEFVTTKDDLSGADIKAVCTEAGLLALRERRMRVTKADFTSAREKVRQLCHIWLSVLTRPPGVVQEERGHSGRTLPVICIVLSLSCICYSPSSLRISQRVRPPEGCQHRSVCPLPGTARLQKVESDNEKHNTGRRRW